MAKRREDWGPADEKAHVENVVGMFLLGLLALWGGSWLVYYFWEWLWS